MAHPVPQAILDALTDVVMPKLPPETVRGKTVRAKTVHVAGFDVPLVRADVLVLGSGAAGLKAAVELKRRGVEVVVATQAVYGGTSACSGSDKQTLHTANGADQGDDFNALARALAAGGAMDEDIAYVEAVGSPRALASLQFLGLPVPVDPLGAVLRYQTDHDEAGRATSCGPRTSRLMVQVLAREAVRLGVPIFNRVVGAKLLVETRGGRERAVGLLGLQAGARTPENPYGFVVFAAPALVLAAGGPGELYRDSVYPKHCFGALGLALEAGVEAVNLTESQFGIGSPRDDFPWNLSGTYVQAMPNIFSRDAAGVERNFLSGYFRSTRALACAIFRKGYQWPFHAERMLAHGSSLVDLAIFRETQAGRKVFMDFNRNLEGAPGDKAFSLDDLDADARAYLENNGALQATPLERLRTMNPLAIELYKRYKIDIAREPLAFAVNNQHMNGGVAVDAFGRTSLAGCYAVGEAAGTHGVTRPGGAALNAGQVFGQRCAEHIVATFRHAAAPSKAPLAKAVESVLGGLRDKGGLAPGTLARDVQARMSDCAGFIVTAAGVARALGQARALNAQITRDGVACAKPQDAAKAVQWRHMAVVSEAVLTALDFYLKKGGGSRGARAVLSHEGSAPEGRDGPLDDCRIKPERVADRAEKICVRRHEGGFVCTVVPTRKRDAARSYFERDWPAYLTGAIYGAP